MRRINKVQTSGKYIVIEYEQDSDVVEAAEVYTVKSKEPPRPELFEAVKKMAVHLSRLCELKKTDSDATDMIRIDSVAFIHSKDYPVDKVEIKGECHLFNGYDLSIKTPKYTLFNDKENKELLEDIDVLKDEARKYIDGNRAQMTMFDDEAKDGDAPQNIPA